MESKNQTTSEQVKRALAEFELSDRLLLSPKEMVEYSNQWVAAYQGKVIAAEHDLGRMRERLDAMRIPLSTVAIRFIEADGRATA